MKCQERNLEDKVTLVNAREEGLKDNVNKLKVNEMELKNAEEKLQIEKEKMMRELEVKELMTKHRNELRNLEMQLSSLKDNECDLQGRIDQLSKERDDALASARDQPGPKVIETSGEIEKLEKQLREAHKRLQNCRIAKYKGRGTDSETDQSG